MTIKAQQQPTARLLWMGNKGRAWLTIRTGQKRWYLAFPHHKGIDLKTPLLCLSAFLAQKRKPTDQYQCGVCNQIVTHHDFATAQHHCMPGQQAKASGSAGRA